VSAHPKGRRGNGNCLWPCYSSKLEQQAATAPACLIEPGLLPPHGILFVGGDPRVGKSLLVANLALSLAAGADRMGFRIPAPRAAAPK
jgi:Mrp family chromosome partitioning ATPase